MSYAGKREFDYVSLFIDLIITMNIESPHE